MLNLVKTYMDLGGGHIQFSVLDTKILRDAQKHPEKYRDLVVRVAGFSAFFTDCTLACRTKSSHEPSKNSECADTQRTSTARRSVTPYWSSHHRRLESH